MGTANKSLTDAEILALENQSKPVAKELTDADILSLDSHTREVTKAAHGDWMDQYAARQASRASKVEDSISSRPSMNDPNKPFTNLLDPRQALRAVGGGFENAEGVPADIMLALQAGKPGRIPGDIKKTLMGQRPAQFGDVLRASDIPVLSNDAVAATVGLGLSASKFTPTGALGNMVAKAVSPVTAGVSTLARNYGAPVVGKAISFLSGVPEADAVKAVQNPEMLSRSWIRQYKPVAQKAYNDVVKPLINNPKARVNTSGLGAVIEKLNLFTPEITEVVNQYETRRVGGEATRTLSKMAKVEAKKVTSWIEQIKSGDMSFNDVDKIIGQIDNGLQKVYSKLEKAKLEPVTKPFEVVAIQLRKALSEVRARQYPDAAAALEKYGRLKTAERVFETFNRWRPNLINLVAMQGLTGGAGALTGSWRNPALYAGALAATSPKAQAFAIQAAGGAVNTMAKNPAIPAELAARAMAGKK